METSRDDARKSYRERSSRRSRDSFSADQYNAGQATYITPDYYQYAGSIPAVEHSYYNSAPEQHSSFNDSDQEDPAEQLIDGHQSDLWEHHSRKPVPVPQYAGYSTSSGLHRSQAQQYQRQTALAPADGAGYFPDTTTLDQWPARVPGPENQASQFVCIQEYPPNGPVTERIPATSSTLASEKTHREFYLRLPTSVH